MISIIDYQSVEMLPNKTSVCGNVHYETVKHPYISVIVVAYDRVKYLQNAVISLLRNNFNHSLYEIVVVKNYRDLKIDEFLSQVKEVEIKNIFTEEESLITKFLVGGAASRGEILCFLEDDDLFAENKLSTIYNAFRQNAIGYCHNGFLEIDKDGNVLSRGKSRLESHRLKIFSPNLVNKNISFLLNYGYHNNSCISIKKDLFMKYKDMISFAGTNWVDLLMLFISVISEESLMILPEALTYYRVHNSLSKFLPSNKADFVRNGIKVSHDDIAALFTIVQITQSSSLKMSGLFFFEMERELVSLIGGVSKNFLNARVIFIAVTGIFVLRSFRSGKIFLLLIASFLIGSKYSRKIMAQFLSNGVT